MNIDTAKEVKSLLEVLGLLNNIKREFKSNSCSVWELTNASTGKSLIIPYSLKDRFEKIINESIEDIEKQIKEL